MEVKVTLSANAGVAIQFGKYRIWADALHTKKRMGFSAVDPELQERIKKSEEFSNPCVIACTHCHADHFSKELTLEAMEKWPSAKVILPEPVFENQITVTGQNAIYRLENLQIEFLRLPHEGKEFENVTHYGILLTAEGNNILISGDCQVASPALTAAIGGKKVHLALMDFPWLTLKSGREYLHKQLVPEHIVLLHLPFARDDCFEYRKSARLWAEKENGLDVHILQEPMQTLAIDI